VLIFLKMPKRKPDLSTYEATITHRRYILFPTITIFKANAVPVPNSRSETTKT
jgi:hypothetical protein